MVGVRVPPDNNDIVVWKLDEATAPFVNSSTSTNAVSQAISNLTTLSGNVITQAPSLFAATGPNSCIQFTSNNSGSPRNFISGANNLEPQAPISISMWMFLRAYNPTGATQHTLSKQHTAGVWSGVFAQVGLAHNRTHVSAPTTWDNFFVTASGTSPTIPPEYTIPLNTWVHTGLTYDGTTQRAYINGVLVGSSSASGLINYGGHGPWFLGAIPSGSGNPEECASSVCDVRIANVVRPQSYFQNIYRQGILPLLEGSSTGSSVVDFYKLRAYDLACTPPQVIYWVNSKISYDGIGSIPCGGLATLSPIEIVESWRTLGVPEPDPSITETLDGLTWLLPNQGNVNTTVCSTVPSTSTFSTLTGDSSILYNVTLRFRGVVETKTYTGGTNDGAYFQTGGTPAVDSYNVYSLTISNPPQVYYLNRGASGLSNTWLIDYIKTIPMRGGATVTLTALSLDSQEIKNQDGTGANPQTVPGLTFPAQPYDGQFIKMDVINVTT